MRTPLRSPLPFFLLASLSLLGVGCPTRQPPEPAAIPPGGAYQSDDGGRTFDQISRLSDGGNITSLTPSGIQIDPFDPAAIIMAAGEFGLLRFQAAQGLWDRVQTPAKIVTGVVIHPRNPHILFIAGTVPDRPDRSKIWKSFDRGETWSEIYAEPVGGKSVDGGFFAVRRQVITAVMSLDVDPFRPEVLFAGSSSGALVITEDGGSTWSTQRSFSSGITGLRVSPDVPSRMYIRLANGTIGRSEDSGKTVTQLSIRENAVVATAVFALFVPPGRPGVVYAGTDQGLFRSKDAGDTWDIVPLPVSSRQFVEVSTIAQGVDGKLFVGSQFNLYISDDEGVTWRIHQFAIPNRIRFLLADPNNPLRLTAFFLPVS